MILDSKNLSYQVIDIADPNKEEDKDFMQNHSTSFGATACDPNPKHPLPPQIFNDDAYCGVSTKTPFTIFGHQDDKTSSLFVLKV